MLKKLTTNFIMLLTLVSCNAEMPSSLLGSYSYPICRAFGGIGAEDSFTCGERYCSYDAPEDKSSICVVDQDAMAETKISYSIGDGYNLITDKTTSSCLTEVGLEDMKEEVVRKADSSFDIVRDHKDFYEKNTTKKKTGLGGFFGWLFGGGYSRTRTTIKENSKVRESMYVTASYSYTTKKLTLDVDEPTLTPGSRQSLYADKLKFRAKCGDRYVKSISQGGLIKLAFKADLNSERSYSREIVQSAFSIGLAGIFSVKTNTTKTREVRELLQTMRVTSTCQSVGASPELCARHQLDQQSYKIEDDVLKARIEQARADLIAEVQAGNVAPIGEELEEYPIDISEGKSLFDYLYDYRPLREKFSKWADLYIQVEENCDAFDYFGSQCSTAKKDLQSLIDICMKQSSWGTKECQEERPFNETITRITDIGEVTFYSGSGSYRADLSDLTVNSPVVPNKIYNFKSLPFGLGEVKNISFGLKPNWQLVLYTGSSGLGETLKVTSGSSLKGRKFSSFEIESR